MAQFDIYIDTYSGEAVGGPSNPSIVSLPRFTQGDSPTYNIYLLKRTTTFPNSTPYVIISTAGLQLKVALGPKDGTPGSTLLTNQFTWASDPTNKFFTAVLPLNTANIAAALATSATTLTWFEVEYTEAGFPTTVLQKQVTINAEVIDTAVIVAPPGATAITAEEVNASFLKRKISGAIYLEDINNPGQWIALYNENGSFKADPVTGALP